MRVKGKRLQNCDYTSYIPIGQNYQENNSIMKEAKDPRAGLTRSIQYIIKMYLFHLPIITKKGTSRKLNSASCQISK